MCRPIKSGILPESKGALHVGLPLRTVVSCRGNPLWLPLRYWLIDKYQKIYASVLTNLNLKLKYLKIYASVLT